MSLEGGFALLLAGDECTALSVQSGHCWNRTGPVAPRADLDGHKTSTPCYPAVPKAGNAEHFSGWRSEINSELSFGRSGGACDKGLLPTTPERDGLGICAGCKN